MKYTYKIQKVIPEKGFMEIVFSMEGKKDILVGGRLPRENESLENVINSYAPLHIWFPKEEKYDIIEEGSVGDIEVNVPTEIIHRDEALQQIYQDAPRVNKDLYSMAMSVDLPHVEILAWRNFNNDVVAFEIMGPNGGPKKERNAKAGYNFFMRSFKATSYLKSIGVPYFSFTVIDNVEKYTTKFINAKTMDLGYEKLMYIPWDEELKQSREKTEKQIIKEKRNQLLAKTDWIFCSDVHIMDKDKWLDYRQKLRDLTLQPGFPSNIIWPEKPYSL